MNPIGHPVEPAKLALRDQLLAARRGRSLVEIGERSRAMAEVVLQLAEVRRAAVVAAYVSVGREPGTGMLLAGLRAAGKRVLLPVLMPDNDVDWALDEGPHALVSASRGLLEPTGPRLGLEAVTGVDVVLVPALAVDRQGNRLGRGGGSYDRALRRVPIDAMVCALLNSEELLDAVPVAAHDRPATAAATELSVVRFQHE